jgi:hypothetical protein
VFQLILPFQLDLPFEPASVDAAAQAAPPGSGRAPRVRRPAVRGRTSSLLLREEPGFFQENPRMSSALEASQK